MKILEMLASGRIGVTATDPASNIVCELCNQFTRLGHQVAVADVKARAPRRLLDRRVRVIEADLPSPHLERSRRPPGFGLRLLKRMLPRAVHPELLLLRGLFGHWQFVDQIASRIRGEDFDIIHVQHGQHAFFLHYRTHRPYVYTNHWQYKPTDNSLDAKIERVVLRRAAAVASLGDYLRAFEPSARYVPIPNGINPDTWQPLDRSQSRKALGIGEEEFVAVFVGRVEHLKGADTLVEMVRHPGFTPRGFRLYLIGDLYRDREAKIPTPFAERLMAEAAGLPVSFLGFMDNMSLEFRRYLSASDVFLLPSRSEAQPLAALEALAMGLPVVATNVGGLGELVTPDIGFRFDPGDTAALAGIVRRLREEPALLSRLRSNARPYVVAHHSWETIAAKYIDLFEKCRASARDPNVKRCLPKPAAGKTR